MAGINLREMPYMREREKAGRFGPLYMLAAAVLFSTGGLLCKLIPWSALAICGVRSLIAAGVIGAYLAVRRHRPVFNRCTAVGAVCYVGTTTLFVMANKMTTAANAIVLQYAAPVWIMVMMALFFGQKPRKAEIITIAVVLAGIVCFFCDSLAAGSLWGDLLALISGVFYAGLFILNSFEEGDTLSALLLGQLVSGVAFTPFLARETDFSAPVLLIAIVMGLIQLGAAYVFFSEGTALTPPVTASLICTVEPILNPILVAIVLRETVTPLSLFGAAVVVLAIVWYNVWKARSRPGPNEGGPSAEGRKEAGVNQAGQQGGGQAQGQP